MIINCDVAEGIGNEEKLFPFIHWANIACGGHAGDDNIMQQTMLLGKQHDVKIGLHPSYPDKENFGRKVMPISPTDLANSIHQQLSKSIAIAKKTNVTINHIKPHGALYNQLANDELLISLFLNIVSSINQSWIIVGLSESKFLQIAASKGFAIAHEVFADRRYTNTKELVSRNNANALIKNKEAMLQQALNFLNNKPITSIVGEMISIKADTICLHGDGLYALEWAIALNKLINNEK